MRPQSPRARRQPVAVREPFRVPPLREWHATLRLKPGLHASQGRAVNRRRETQPMRALWNLSGYMRNVVEVELPLFEIKGVRGNYGFLCEALGWDRCQSFGMPRMIERYSMVTR